MIDEVEPLDPTVRAKVVEQLLPNECIHSWRRLQNGDVQVRLIDRDLQRTILPFVEKAEDRTLGSGRSLVFVLDNGNWSLIGSGSWGIGEPNLLRYFKAAAGANTDSTSHRGIHLCYRWISLRINPSGRQNEVDEVLALLAAESAASPVWKEMRRQFTHWATGCGFLVPDVVFREQDAAADVGGH